MTPGDRVGADMVTLERYIARTASGSRVRVRRVKGKPMAMMFRTSHGYASLLTADEVEFVRRRAKQRPGFAGWNIEVERADITVDRLPWVDGDTDCNPDLLRRLNAVGRDLGEVVFIRSGERTIAEQTVLWNRYGPPRAARPNPNAPHVRGVAADCGINGRDIGDHPGARAAMRRHDVCLPVPGEDWHVETGNRWAA